MEVYSRSNIYDDGGKAYDSLHRSKLLKVMGQLHIPPKVINLTHMTMKKTTSRVTMGGTFSEKKKT